MTGLLMTGVVVILLGFLYWRRKQMWKVVYEGAELTEQASDQYSILQEQGIRCRMRNVPLPSQAGAGFADRGGAVDPVNVKFVVEIHRDDLKAAKRLLEQRVSGRYEFTFESA